MFSTLLEESPSEQLKRESLNAVRAYSIKAIDSIKILEDGFG